MNKLDISIYTLLMLIGLLRVTPLALAEEFTESQYDIEEQAMQSLGYQAVAQTAAYPEDRYAMPEPYSSEQLVTYAIRVQEYKSRLATNNTNKD